MNDFTELITSSIEYRQLGWNSKTLFSFCTMILSLFQGWGLIQQADTIRENRSGESVPIIPFTFGLSYCIAFGYYGYHTKGVCIIFNALILTLAHIPLVLALVRYKQWRFFERMISVSFVGMVPIMIMIENKDGFLLALLVCVLYMVSIQPYELIVRKKVGSVNPKLTLVYLVTSVFWWGYAFSIKNTALILFNPTVICIHIATLSLWWKYRPKLQVITV